MPVGDPKLAKLVVEKLLIIRVGDEAPDFEAKTLAGQPIKLSDYRGKVVLLDFWATWCAPCLAELPNIERAYRRYGKEGQLVIIGVSLDFDGATVRRFLRRRKPSWPQLAVCPADENPVAKLYNVTNVPATFLIDGQGKVVAKDLRGRSLRKQLRKLLSSAGGQQAAVQAVPAER